MSPASRFRSALVTATLLLCTASPRASGAEGAPPGGVFTINGAVGRPVTLTVGQLAALPVRSVAVDFQGEKHTFRGPLVSDVLAVARPTVPAAGAHQLMLTVVTAGGEQVSLAYGELDGASATQQPLLAFEEDGKSLAGAGPRLVMAGDTKGGRSVARVTSITVTAAAVGAPVDKPPAGSVVVTGAVTAPKTYTFDQLKAFPQVPTKITGAESHTEEGPLLSDVYKDVGLAPPEGAKNGALRLVTEATSDAAKTLVGVGETESDQPILSLKEDGTYLTAPRLVVPRDQKVARDITAVFNLTVRNPTPDTTMAPGLADKGVRLINANGIVTSSGGASSRGDLTGKTLQAPIVSADTAPIPDSYWMAGRDGGVFNFGGAGFYGSTGDIVLNKPIVDIAATTTGKGYWLTASDGGVFAFGDAGFFGSTGNIVLNKPVVAMGPTPSGKGYISVASDGGVFAFGDAKFNGSTGAITLASPIVDFAMSPSGNGYLLLAADGGVFAFGDAKYVGRDPSTKPNSVRLIPSVIGAGYRIVHSDATVTSIGSLPPLSKVSVSGAVVAATS